MVKASRFIAAMAALCSMLLIGSSVAEAAPQGAGPSRILGGENCDGELCIVVTSKGCCFIQHVEVYSPDVKMGRWFLDVTTSGGTARNTSDAPTPDLAAGFSFDANYSNGDSFCGGALHPDGSPAPGRPCIWVVS